MPKTELWKKLDRTQEIPGTLGCDLIMRNESGLTLIYLSEDEQKKIIIIFDALVYSFKSSMESVYVRTQLNFSKDKIDELFSENNWLFELKNSRYVKWIKEEGDGMFEYESLRHFVFYTFSDVIEVLCCFPPKITIEEL